MRKWLAVWAGLCLALTVAAPAAAVTGATVTINPFHMTTATAAVGDTVVLEVGWGACIKGLDEAFIHTAQLDWSIDGVPLPTTPVWTAPAPSPYSGPYQCMAGGKHDTTTWWTFGQYPTTFTAGTHTVSVVVSVSHRIADGGVYDADNGPDPVGPGAFMQATMVLTVNP